LDKSLHRLSGSVVAGNILVNGSFQRIQHELLGDKVRSISYGKEFITVQLESSSVLIPLVDLSPQKAKIQNQLESRIANVMNHAKFILGPKIKELEQLLADYSGTAHVVTYESGTGTLTLALLTLGHN